MRISFLHCCLLSLAVISLSWWLGTRGHDFLREPPVSGIAETRRLVEQAYPVPEQPFDAVSAPSIRTPPPLAARELIPSADELRQDPQLDDYRKHASHGAARLADLAGWLEARGHHQRALLAWERVIDSTRPKPEQRALAMDSIQRLKTTAPHWNPDTAHHLILNAGTDNTAAMQVRPILEECSRNLELASSGILRVSVKITTSQQPLNPNGPTPVVLWFTGASEPSKSSDILSIEMAEQMEQTGKALEQSVYRIVRAFIDTQTKLTAPPPLDEHQAPMDVIRYGITRLAWKQLGQNLNSET